MFTFDEPVKRHSGAFDEDGGAHTVGIICIFGTILKYCCMYVYVITSNLVELVYCVDYRQPFVTTEWDFSVLQISIYGRMPVTYGVKV